MQRRRTRSPIAVRSYPWLLNGARLQLLPPACKAELAVLSDQTELGLWQADAATRGGHALPFAILEKERKSVIGLAWVLRTPRPTTVRILLRINRESSTTDLGAEVQSLLCDEFRRYGPLQSVIALDTPAPGQASFSRARGSWRPRAPHNSVAVAADLAADALHGLAIPADYVSRRGLSAHAEPRRLRSVGRDIYGRRQYLLPAAAQAFFAMRQAAYASGIELDLVSAFRSATYQAGIVRRKLAQGKAIADILAVNAAPGYSEHHSGCAIDLTCAGFAPLEEVFEESPAYSWLCANAQQFKFRLSYPRGNSQGYGYEPWHWCYVG